MCCIYQVYKSTIDEIGLIRDYVIPGSFIDGCVIEVLARVAIADRVVPLHHLPNPLQYMHVFERESCLSKCTFTGARTLGKG